MFGKALKSMVRSGVEDLRARFSDAEEVDEFPTPFGLRIGAAVDIDTLPLRMHADELHVKLPEETLIIVAQGYIDLGDSTYVHRYYTADDIMIQVLTVAGVEDQHVQELTLFTPYRSFYPDTPGAWAQWTADGGKLGDMTFTLEDGAEFARIWFDSTEGHAKPVVFTESVYEDPESDECDDVVHTAMLFGRNLEDDKKNEYLLVSVEDYDDQRSVELMVGVDLEIANMRVI